MATLADHGTDIGWQNDYGNDQAVFTGPVVIESSYWVFDGQTGGGPNSWDRGHGFKIEYTGKATSGVKLLALKGPGYYAQPDLPQYIILSHIEFQHRGRYLYDANWTTAQKEAAARQDDCIYSTIANINFYSQEGEKKGPGYITVRYCYLHDSARMFINTVYAHHWTIEYNYFARNMSTDIQHAEAWQDYGSDDVTIRYNLFQDIEGTAFFALKKSFNMVNDNWFIYGNIFCNRNRLADDSTYHLYQVGEGIFTGSPDTTSAPSNNIYFYNNTIINVAGYSAAIKNKASNKTLVYNNLWYSCYVDPQATPLRGNIAFHGSIEEIIKTNYNTFIKTAIKTNVTQLGEADLVDEEGVDPFINWSNFDFRLNSPTDAGIPLGQNYDTDMFGKIRGADGLWDRGAIEF